MVDVFSNVDVIKNISVITLKSDICHILATNIIFDFRN